MAIKHYSEIIAWQKAHRLTIEIYCITKAFPSNERYGLISQLRRAAVSVGSNIAEGFWRKGIKDSIRFYRNAQGSLNEVDYQLFLSYELGYIPVLEYENLKDLAKESLRVLLGWIEGHS